MEIMVMITFMAIVMLFAGVVMPYIHRKMLKGKINEHKGSQESNSD